MANTITPSTYDYETESADIARKMKVLEAMQAQAMQPVVATNPGPVASPVSPLAGVGKVLQAYFLSKHQQNLEGEQKALATRYSGDISKGLQDFYRTSTGYEAPSMALQPNADGTPQNVQVPPNAKKAVLDALATNNPVLRQFAMQQLAEQAKNAAKPSDFLHAATPESVLRYAQTGKVTDLAPKRDVMNGTPGDVMLDKNTGQMIIPGAPGPAAGGAPSPAPASGTPTAAGGLPSGPGWSTMKIDGDLYQVSPTGMKKLDNAPKVIVSAVAQAQKAGLSEYFKKAAEQVDNLGKIANTASNMKQALAELQNLGSQGIYSNASSGAATFLTNLGQAAGVKIPPEKLAKMGNTETYNAIITDVWQGLVKQNGGNRGVTEQEAKTIKEMLPLAAYSPPARQQLFSILGNVADRQVKQYQAANTAFAEAASKDDPAIFAKGFSNVYYPQPNQPAPVTPAAGGGAGVPMSLDAYLKSKGVQ